MRYGDASKSKVSKRKKLNVEPGKNVGLADFPSTSTDKNLEEESEANSKENYDDNELDQRFPNYGSRPTGGSWV